jgi:wobble nucleotide-excising tRNase
MKTIIYEYIDKADRSQIMTGVGTEKRFNEEIHNNAIQILRVLEKNYPQKKFESIIQMDNEELLYTIDKIKKTEKLKIFYPN